MIEGLDVLYSDTATLRTSGDYDLILAFFCHHALSSVQNMSEVLCIGGLLSRSFRRLLLK